MDELHEKKNELEELVEDPEANKYLNLLRATL